jgi:hypothetical protein
MIAGLALPLPDGTAASPRVTIRLSFRARDTVVARQADWN